MPSSEKVWSLASIGETAVSDSRLARQVMLARRVALACCQCKIELIQHWRDASGTRRRGPTPVARPIVAGAQLHHLQAVDGRDTIGRP